jgi:hypothetical protein
MPASLDAFIGQPLTWTPTDAFRDRYTLVTPDNTTLGNLDISTHSSTGHATVPGETFFMHKEGWTDLKLNIYADEQSPPIATFQRQWAGKSGQLLFPDGREFKLAKTNFSGTDKAWYDATGKIIYVQFTQGAFSRKAVMTILPQAASLTELPLLVAFGAYIIHIESRETNSNLDISGGIQ